MTRKAKTPKFKLFNSSLICFGELQEHDGRWQDLFDLTKPLTIEVGCARAELLLELAKTYPYQNFVGVDRKSDRMWRPSITANELKMNNIAFVQTDIRKLAEYFDADSVDVLWITFPDPYPRDRQEKHRLINTKFLDIYKSILKPDGVIRFKTDDNDLYDYLINEVIPERKDVLVVSQTRDLHSSDFNEEYKIKTTYEKKWLALGKNVSFCEFRFK